MNAQVHRCPECGSAIANDAPHGICPQCLMDAGTGECAETSPNFLLGKTQIASEVRPVARSLDAKGRRFGDYELLEEIARGGMGVVYKARQISLDRIVAIKMILGGPLASKEFIHRFRTEAAAAANLQHPNIVAVHEVGAHEGENFLAMDFVDGPNLTHVVGQQPLPAQRAARYLEAVAEAIHYAHERGILHRDLKPSNILVGSDDQPRVTDFGLAKRLETESELTLSGQVLGSPNYMSPEQASGKRGQVGKRSDLYSLGAVLYHLLTARPPFQAGTLTDTLQEVLNTEPVSPRLLNPSVPLDLETICLRCLEKEPEKRYQTAKELAEELNRFLNDETILARPVTRPERAWRWCRRKPALAGSLFIIVILLLIVIIGSPIAAFRINRERQRVETGAKELRKSLYLADMSAVQQALQENNLGRALDRLNEYFKPEKKDLRGLEWRYLWNLCQGDETFTLHFNDYAVAGLTFSPDGRLLAVASLDNKVTILDAATKKVLKRLKGFFRGASYSQMLTFTPDGKFLAAGDKAAVNLWRTSDWELAYSLEIPSAAFGVSSLALSPEGATLACVAHGKLKLWDFASRREKTDVFPTTIGELNNVTYSSDGKMLAVSSENGIEAWDTTSGSGAGHFTRNMKSIDSLAASSRWLAAGNWLGELKMWDLETGEEVVSIKAHSTFLFGLAFSRDGKTLMTGGGDQKIYFWDLTSFKPQASERGEPVKPPTPVKIGTLRGHVNEIWALAFSPDGKTLVSGGKDGTAKFWSAIPKQHENLLTDARSVVRFSDDGRSLLTANENESLIYWDIQSREKLRGIDIGFTGSGAESVAISSDEKKLAIGRKDGAVEVWNLDTRQRTATNQVNGGAVWRLTFSPKDNWLMALSGEFVNGEEKMTVTVFNLGTGQPQTRFLDTSWGRAFSPDEKLDAVAIEGNTIVVRDLTKQKDVARLQGHTMEIIKLAFSPDGKRLVSTSSDSTVRLWDTASWKPLEVLRGHMGGVGAASFSTDGRLLASASADDTLKLWDVSVSPAQELLNFRRPTHRRYYGSFVIMSPDKSVIAMHGDSEATGQDAVLLLRAPSFAEIDAREKAKDQAKASVSRDE